MAADIHIVTALRSVGPESFSEAITCENLNCYWFNNWYAQQGVKILSDEAVAILAEKIASDERHSLSGISEEAEERLNLAL